MKPHVFPPQRMLVATDMSQTSAAALAFARRLREQFSGSVHVMYAHYFEMPAYFSSGQSQALAKELANLRNEAARQLRKMSQEALGETPEVRVVERPPVQAILETSQSLQADLVIVGTHGRRGTERVWLGSVAEQVLRLSRRPVLAVRPDSRIDRIRHVLCPVAPTESSFVALDYASQMAKAPAQRFTPCMLPSPVRSRWSAGLWTRPFAIAAPWKRPQCKETRRASFSGTLQAKPRM